MCMRAPAGLSGPGSPGLVTAGRTRGSRPEVHGAGPPSSLGPPIPVGSREGRRLLVLARHRRLDLKAPLREILDDPEPRREEVNLRGPRVVPAADVTLPAETTPGLLLGSRLTEPARGRQLDQAATMSLAVCTHTAAGHDPCGREKCDEADGDGRGRPRQQRDGYAGSSGEDADPCDRPSTVPACGKPVRIGWRPAFPEVAIGRVPTPPLKPGSEKGCRPDQRCPADPLRPPRKPGSSDRHEASLRGRRGPGTDSG